MIPKYINVNDFVNRTSAVTVKEICDELKAAPAADVIPVEWIEAWYRSHYRTSNAALIDDWRRANNG